MKITKSRGITLVENLVAILLVSVLLVSILGAFFVSRSSAVRARHRMTAMSLVREWMEKVTKIGYIGIDGDQDFKTDTDSVREMPDGVTYRIYRYPQTLPELREGGPTGIPYTMRGFKVEWDEDIFDGKKITCSEKAVTYVARP